MRISGQVVTKVVGRESFGSRPSVEAVREVTLLYVPPVQAVAC